MSQDHQLPIDQGAEIQQNDVPASDAAARPEPPALADPMEVLIQASQAAESLQKRFAELQALQAKFKGEEEQLTADRAAFENRASEFAQHVAHDRVEQRQIRSELDEESRRARQLVESLDEGHARLNQSEADLKSERIRLQQAVTDELASDRESLQAEQDALTNDRAALVQERTDLEASFEARQKLAEEELESERQALRERIREEFNSEFAQLNRERQEWNDRHTLEHEQLRDESETLQQQRELLGEQISAEQSRLSTELEKRRQALLTEQTNLQRRYRFQFEHLARARNDFDNEVRQLRRDQQSVRAERQKFQEQHRMQLRKLSRIRELLDEREASLKRELRIIERSRAATQMDLQRQQRQLQEHRDSVNHELEERTRQVSLQEGSISQSTQRLAEKTQQLNRLRSDLDAQQRDLLELRIIMEEVQSDLSKQHSDRQLSVRQQQARGSLESFFDELHRRVREERQEVEGQMRRLDENRSAFRHDREQLEQWFEQNEGLPQQPPVAPQSRPTAEQLVKKEELDRLRSEWAADLSESEAKLRAALDELETLQRSGFFERPPDEVEEDSQRTAA